MSGHVGELEKELLTRRWSSLKIAGRFGESRSYNDAFGGPSPASFTQHVRPLLKSASFTRTCGIAVNPAPEWREQGLWEWLLWKVVLTPLEWVSPTVYPEFEVPEELERVVEPDWKVLAAKETAGRLNFTWVSRLELLGR